MRTVTIGGKLYQVRASVYDVVTILSKNERRLLEIENNRRNNKKGQSEYELITDFIIDSLWQFLVPKRILGIPFKPFLSKKSLKKAISIDELKEIDTVIADLTGLAKGEPKTPTQSKKAS